MPNLIIKNISKLFSPLPQFGKFKEYYNASVIITDGKIACITENEVEINAIKLENYRIIDAKGMIALPGFVDSHAHPVFAETREMEFEMRNQGKSYLEIAEQGGGIRNSVRKLRALSEDELYKRTLTRIQSFLANGTTTLEAKSGYGLTLDDEIKMLKVIKRLATELDLELVPTFLGAHEIPDEFREDREGYISLIINEMLPRVAEQQLAEACDIFIEKNVYTIEEGRRILGKAKELGLKIKVHADQLTYTGGCELAAELGAVSAEHFEYASDAGIKEMAKEGVIFNLLPGAAYFIGSKDYPPARKVIAAGGICALATDFNPGTCFTTSLPLIMNIGAIYMKMTAEELIWAATRGGALALERADNIGSLEVGMQADILLTDIRSLQELPYSLGINRVKNVIKKGRVVI